MANIVRENKKYLMFLYDNVLHGNRFWYSNLTTKE